MKKHLLIFFLVLLSTQQLAIAQAFVTVWKTDNTGTSMDTQITIPTRGGGYDYNISWEEVGNPTHSGTDSGLTSDHTIEFGTAGTYRIEITGTFPRIYFNFGGDKSKILEVAQWGSNVWNSMERSFGGCDNLTITASDTPDLSTVTDMSWMFSQCTIFNQDIGGWDVSNVTTMERMFYQATSFNQDIGSWNVSNVTNMNFMFERATSFNQNIGLWNTGNVTTMRFMFSGAVSFNQYIGGWNVSKVNHMGQMFENAINFNQDIGNWNVSNVSNMQRMFAGATSFNKSIDNWDVSNVGYMSQMFFYATSFDQAISSWDVSNVTDMSGMFRNATGFNQNVGSWYVGKVTNMREMFKDATIFNQDIGGWDVSSVTDMYGMFSNVTAFNQDIGGWDVSSVTNMATMFDRVTNFNHDIGNWNVANVTDMSAMFSTATSFNQDISNWDTKSLTVARYMFGSASSFNQPIGSWDLSRVTDMTGMFGGASSFNQDIGTWNVGNVTSFSSVFYQASAFNQDISNWDVSKATTMQHMFYRTTNFNQNLGSWDVSNVTNMSYMFDATNISSGNYDLTLQGWSEQAVQSGTDLGAFGLSYCAGLAARQQLITKGWSITGDAQDCGQTISFGALDPKKMGDSNFELTATSNSGLSISYTSSNLSVASVFGSEITIVGAGTTVITASQVGDDSYDAAIPVEQTLIINVGNQEITFDHLDVKVVNDPVFDLTASSDSGLPVSYSSSDTNVASILGNTVTIMGVAGSTVITASQAGNSSYNAAVSVEQTLTISPGNQTITFDAIDSKMVGDPVFELTATSSSGLPVTYSSSNINVANVTGSTITIVGAGVTTITASQIGDENYNVAVSVEQELIVNKISQTIAFDVIEPKTVGGPAFELVATSDSGLPVSYGSSNAEVATVLEGTVTIVGAGTAIITASQSGDENYNAAASVGQELIVNKINQIIDFDQLDSKTENDPSFELIATASSGLPVSYSSSDTNVANVTGNTVTITGVGMTTITASQDGNASYGQASPIEQILEIKAVLSLEGQVEVVSPTIFPNPVHQELNIEWSVFELATLSELSGRVLLSSKKQKIDLSNLSGGVYVLTLSDGKDQMNQIRIIKKD